MTESIHGEPTPPRSADGGLAWSQPEVIVNQPSANLWEPGLVRSPDVAKLSSFDATPGRRIRRVDGVGPSKRVVVQLRFVDPLHRPAERVLALIQDLRVLQVRNRQITFPLGEQDRVLRLGRRLQAIHRVALLEEGLGTSSGASIPAGRRKSSEIEEKPKPHHPS